MILYLSFMMCLTDGVSRVWQICSTTRRSDPEFEPPSQNRDMNKNIEESFFLTLCVALEYPNDHRIEGNDVAEATCER